MSFGLALLRTSRLNDKGRSLTFIFFGVNIVVNLDFTRVELLSPTLNLCSCCSISAFFQRCAFFFARAINTNKRFQLGLFEAETTPKKITIAYYMWTKCRYHIKVDNLTNIKRIYYQLSTNGTFRHNSTDICLCNKLSKNIKGKFINFFLIQKIIQEIISSGDLLFRLKYPLNYARKEWNEPEGETSLGGLDGRFSEHSQGAELSVFLVLQRVNLSCRNF